MDRQIGVLCGAVIAGATFPALSQYEARLELLGLKRPTQVVASGAYPNLLYITEQWEGTTGRVRAYDVNTGTLHPDPFATIEVSTGNSQGVLGVAFHPADPTRAFIKYTRPDGSTVIDEYSINPAQPQVADASVPPKTILVVSQPSQIHNGGWMSFGPDGYLWIAMGDGGPLGFDPDDNAQDLATLRGGLLRVDVDHPDAFPDDDNRNYAIPPGNPYIGNPAADPALWAIGLRMPWRCDFDPATGDLWIGDVGQGWREEVDILPAGSTGGENFGWSCWEGTREASLDCPGGVIFPVHEYDHDSGCAIIGGLVVRGCRMPSLNGAYLFADFCAHTVSTIRETAPGVFETEEITSQINVTSGSLRQITSFGRDVLGRVYVTTLSGRIYRLDTTEFTPDINDDNAINTNDFFAFLALYQAQDPGADATGEGDINTNDFFAFLASFQQGC